MTIEKISEFKFNLDKIARYTIEGYQFWYARELQEVLGYSKWENFSKLIDRAIDTCNVNGYNISDHFYLCIKTVELAKGAIRQIKDYKISKYGCYLIAMNGDPSQKEMVAFAQAYFASMTCQIEEIYDRLNYNTRNINRNTLCDNEKIFSSNMINNGVSSSGVARIRSNGDKAFFGGYNTQQMKDMYNIPNSKPLADYLPSVTLAAKNAATEATNYNIIRKRLYGEEAINDSHIFNNSYMRDFLIENDVYPEEIPPEEDIKKVKRRVDKCDRSLAESCKLPDDIDNTYCKKKVFIKIVK